MSISMLRQPEHVMSYLLAELNSTGSLDGHQRFVVNGKLAPKTIEGILKRYVGKFLKILDDFISVTNNISWEVLLFTDNYVICEYCKNPNTVLSKEDNQLFVRCEKVCHYVCLLFSFNQPFQNYINWSAKS